MHAVPMDLKYICYTCIDPSILLCSKRAIYTGGGGWTGGFDSQFSRKNNPLSQSQRFGKEIEPIINSTKKYIAKFLNSQENIA